MIVEKPDKLPHKLKTDFINMATGSGTTMLFNYNRLVLVGLLYDKSGHLLSCRAIKEADQSYFKHVCDRCENFQHDGSYVGLELGHAYTHELFRRRGYSKALMALLLGEIRSYGYKGYHKQNIFSTTANPASKKLLEENGFNFCGTYPSMISSNTNSLYILNRKP